MQNGPPSFFGAEFIANPHPFFGILRTMGPFIQLPFSFGAPGQKAWLVTRWAEAVQILKDDSRFTVDPSRIRGHSEPLATARGGFLLGRTMVSVDEPDHRRLRSLVSKAFTPRYVADLTPLIQRHADMLIDRVYPQGAMDVVNDFAYPLSINVIASMLGIPDKQRENIRAWSAAIIGNGFRTTVDTETATSAHYIRHLVAEKRRAPQDDLISLLVQIEEAGDRLDEDELLSMVALLIFAGHETTANFISAALLALLEQPAHFVRLRAEPALLPTAIEELLRFCGPVLTPAPRFTVIETQLGDHTLYPGDALIISLASADRDQTQFTNPEDLDLARQLNRHLAFGQGIHNCMGAPLARLESQIAFTTLLHRLPNLRLASAGPPTWRGNFNLRGLATLPIVF